MLTPVFLLPEKSQKECSLSKQFIQDSSIYRTRPVIIFRFFFRVYFGFHLGPYSITLMQQKLLKLIVLE